VPGSTSSPVILEIYTVTGFNSDGSAIFTLKGAVPGCPNTAPQGLTKLATNDFADATAPPWNVPACDPTSDNSANTCRLVKGAYTDPSHQLLPPRDFAEASIDLRAFGINPCVNTFIFTSRSSHDLSSSLDDVGGGDFNLCGNISGTKFQDTNADGVRGTATAEPGLANWPIYLYQDTDGNGTLSSSEYSGQPTGFPLTTTTASDGSYTFHSVSSGNYIICEAKTAPSGLGTGWIQSDPANTKCQAGDFNGASPLLADGGYAVTMMGLDVTGKDFGNYQNGSISGTKFKDANADGVKGSTEAGLGGWSIKLFADTDGNGTLSSTEAATAAATTTTANDGTYSFPAVKPGTYIVCEVLDNGALQTHVGWVQSYPLSTTVGSASCAGSSTLGARGWNVTVTSGSSTTAQDIGNTPLSNITVTFNPLAKLPDGTTAATKATSMSCVDKNSSSVGSNSNSNSLTTSNVKNNQSSVVCTVTFTDP
jgi:hypothetical protein